MMAYPPWLHWPALLVAVALAVALLVVGIGRRDIRVAEVAVGLGVGIATAVVSGLLAWALFKLVQGFHPELGRLHGSSFHREGWYYLAVLAFSVTVFLGIMETARRRFGLAGLAMGGSVLPVVVAVPLAATMPLAALNLVWPVLFGQVALFWFFLRLQEPSSSQWERFLHLAVLAFLLLPVTTLLVPMTETLWIAMSLALAPALAVLATLTLLLLLPLLAPLFSLPRWKGPALVGAAGLAFLGLGIVASEPGPESPIPMSLFYQMDREAERAWWATADGSEEPWIRERVPHTQREEGEETFFPRGYFTAPAEPVEVPEPEVMVLRDTILDIGRVVRLAITSRIGAERIDIRPAPGTEARLIGVNEKVLGWEGETGTGPVGGGGQGSSGLPLQHWGDPAGPVEVEFAIPVEANGAEFLLMERAWRPERFVGPEPFRRPLHLIPAIRGTSDVAIFGIRVRVGPPPHLTPS